MHTPYGSLNPRLQTVIAVRFRIALAVTVHRSMALDPLITSALEGLPELLLIVRRDGVLLGASGGRSVAALVPDIAGIGQKLESIWPQQAAATLRHLVRQALASRATHDATLSESGCRYELRVVAQGPDRVLCTVRQPACAQADDATSTGRFGAVAVQFDRRSFLRRFQESLSMATLREEPTAVAVIHVDGVFDVSRIIDTHVAEQAMSAVLSRLVQQSAGAAGEQIPWYVGQLSESQIVFVIQSRDRDKIEALVERQCASLREPIRVGDAEFHLTPYAGVAILGPDATSPKRLLNHARGAAAEARRAGIHKVCFFSDTVRLRSLARMDIAQELRDAIADRSIKLRYMARRDLASGELVAAVGYMHWRHPLRGEVSPSEFIAVAEATGLATALSRSALSCIRDDYAALREIGGPNLTLSYGPLRHHILDEAFLTDVSALFADGLVQADRFELRLGERSLFASDMSLLHAVARTGVKLIVDELGRGIGSFDVLARAPLAGMQLDRSWIQGLPNDATALKICRAGLALAKSIGLDSIARGIDSDEQRKVLSALGCRYGIGALYGEVELQKQAVVHPRMRAARRQ
jgi:EAL domain-containing protein (putative c-di-GMP-specific phosphodiesterase class I)/GGDEF domain-containing protein